MDPRRNKPWLPTEWPPKNEIAVSHLACSTYAECQRKWLLRYRVEQMPPGRVAKLKDEKSLMPANALRGRLVDDVLKDTFRSYADGQGWLADPLLHARDVFAHLIEATQEWAEARRAGRQGPFVEQPIEQIYYGEPFGAREIAEVQEHVDRCLRNFLESDLPTYFETLPVEHWCAPRRGSREITPWWRRRGAPAYAAYDFMVCEPGVYAVIVDWKTGNLQYGEEAAWEQLHGYALYAMEHLQVPPESIDLIPGWLSVGPVRFRDFRQKPDPDVLDRVDQKWEAFRLELEGKLGDNPPFREMWDRFPPTQNEQSCRSCTFHSCPQHKIVQGRQSSPAQPSASGRLGSSGDSGLPGPLEPAGIQEAERWLRQAFGPGATFREGQWECIESVAVERGRLLVVQRTGWGKSIVYFLATRLLRDRGAGPTLLVSPLLALMRNQVDLAARLRLRAESFDSTNRDEWDDKLGRFRAGQIDLLLVSPERLGAEEFRDSLLPVYLENPGLLVIDEAHCISDWGHDFRPDYRRIVRLVESLSAETPVLATTATANDRVVADVREQLGPSLQVRRGPLMRESLVLSALRMSSQSERLAWIGERLHKLKGSGIVYTLTVADSERVAEFLRQEGHDVAAYHSDLPTETKVELERKFLGNELRALVATTALGMGYDKPDVAFVIHYQRPGSIIAYYQQIGRAGRELPKAYAALLVGDEDDAINEHFIRSSFPDADCFQEVLGALAMGPSNLDGLLARVNRRRSQVSKALEIMLIHGAIQRTRGVYQVVDPNWTDQGLRSEQVVSQRLLELRQMEEYTGWAGCRMEFLARALDDPGAKPCGQCDNCRGSHAGPPSKESVARASAFLRGGSIVFEPKSFFPASSDGRHRRKIPAEDRLEPGIALSVYNDGGWGAMVREGKYVEGRYSDELVEHAAQAVRQMPEPPEWVAWIPSVAHPGLVESVAVRLAAALGIPAVDCIRKAKANRPQKEMQNSSAQFANVWDAFEIAAPLPGRCLLVDDIVDSGWTLTAAGIRLRRAGSGPVVPLALASARPRSNA